MWQKGRDMWERKNLDRSPLYINRHCHDIASVEATCQFANRYLAYIKSFVHAPRLKSIVDAKWVNRLATSWWPCHVRLLDDIPPSVNTPNSPRYPTSVIMSSALANYSRSRHLSRQVHCSSRLLHAAELYVSATYCEPAKGLEDGCQVVAWNWWKLLSHIHISRLHDRASLPGRCIRKCSYIRASSDPGYDLGTVE